MSLAEVRILRMAVGTALCLLLSQIVNWPLSFVAPVFTLVILALPLPALPFAAGAKFVVVFLVAIFGSLLFLPFVVHYPVAGLLLTALALYWSFYFTAKGGSAVLGTFATVGITLVAAIGSVSIDAVLSLSGGLTIGILVGVAFTWVGHAIMPDSKALAVERPQPAAKEQPDTSAAASNAWRSLMIVMPVLIWFLLSAASVSYVALMIKVATMGQQASLDKTRHAARSLIESTLIGGAAAIVGWHVLSVMPSLAIYVLIVALAGLLAGPRIFRGAGMQVNGATWSYGFVTMLIILAPAVMDSQAGSSAGAAFYSRLLMFLLASLYGMAAVWLFDKISSPNRKTATVS